MLWKATLWRLPVGGFLCEKWFESALVDRWQKSFMRWYHFGGNRCIILTCFPRIGQNQIQKLTSLNLGPTINVGKKHSCRMWVSKKTPTYPRNTPQPLVYEGNPFILVYFGLFRGFPMDFHGFQRSDGFMTHHSERKKRMRTHFPIFDRHSRPLKRIVWTSIHFQGVIFLFPGRVRIPVTKIRNKQSLTVAVVLDDTNKADFPNMFFQCSVSYFTGTQHPKPL